MWTSNSASQYSGDCSAKPQNFDLYRHAVQAHGFGNMRLDGDASLNGAQIRGPCETGYFDGAACCVCVRSAMIKAGSI